MAEVYQDPVVRRHWHVVGRSAEITPGKLSPATIAGQDIVLWRGAKGINAWRDLCLHRGVPLSLGQLRDCRVHCAYHGWTYDEDGSCVHMPAHPSVKPPSKAKVQTYSVHEVGGLVWVCLDDNPPRFSALPEFSDPSFRAVVAGPYEVKAGAPRVIENFLDVAHLPIVHEGSLGVPGHAEIGAYQVELSPEGFLEARGIRVYQPDPDGTAKAGEVSYDYGIMTPFTVFLRKKHLDNCFSLLLHATPLTETATRAWFIILMDYGDPKNDAEAVAFQDKIFRQDLPIVESQHPERLPLDLAAELHLPSDRLAIAYRKFIRESGLTFATA